MTWLHPANLFTDDLPSTVTRSTFHLISQQATAFDCRFESQSPEQVNATGVPFRSKLKTLMTGTNRLDCTNVLGPHSLQCTDTKPNQRDVIILRRFDLHSLHCGCCFNSLGLVSFLGKAFLAHIAGCSQLPRLVALVRLPTLNASQSQVSSPNKLFSLQLRLTRV